MSHLEEIEKLKEEAKLNASSGYKEPQHHDCLCVYCEKASELIDRAASLGGKFVVERVLKVSVECPEGHGDECDCNHEDQLRQKNDAASQALSELEKNLV